MGFQTARQINNKLKEPNRMKKDPLTQTSINSFFSPNKGRRETEDNMNFDQNDSEPSQSAKRRKVSHSNDYVNVKVKSEPIDEPMPESANTLNGGQISIKKEPTAYDSDYAGTDEGSDNEESIPTLNGATLINVKREPGTENQTAAPSSPPPLTTTQIKEEIASDNDTDTPSDGEDNDHVPNSISNHATQLFRVKIEPDLELQSTARETSPAVQYNDEHQHEQMEIDSEVKEEPRDDPIDSGEETDDEQDAAFKGQNANPPHHQQNANQNRDENIDWYQHQQPSTSSHYSQHHFDQSNSGEAHSTKSLNPVGSKSLRSVSTGDGDTVRRFNNFEPADEMSSHDHDMTDDEDDEKNDDFDEFNGLDEELENYVKLVERETAADVKRLQKFSTENHGQKELIALQRKAEELKKKAQLMKARQVKEFHEKAEEQKERERDKFLQNLFGPVCDFSAFNQICRINADDEKPSTSTGQHHRRPQAASSDTEDKKDIKPVTWRNFMGLPKKEADHKKTDKQHYVSVILDEHIKLKHKQNKLDEVPVQAIKHVKQDKELIKSKVDRVLQPLLQQKKITTKQYESLCKTTTHTCFDVGIYGEFLPFPAQITPN